MFSNQKFPVSAYDAPTPVTPETAAVSGLVVDDDRRTRRRGSQL